VIIEYLVDLLFLAKEIILYLSDLR